MAQYLSEIVRDYLSERSVYIEKNLSMRVAAGTPQGSVLSLVLWNIMHNEIFEIGLLPRVELIGFADNVGITVSNNNKSRLLT